MAIRARFTSHRWLWLFIAGVLAIALGADALANDAASGLIFACANLNSGALKIVPANTTCRDNEALLSWSSGPGPDLTPLQTAITQLQQQVSAIISPPMPQGGTPGATALVGAPSATPGGPVTTATFGSLEVFLSATDVFSAGTGDVGFIELLAFPEVRICSVHGPGVGPTSLNGDSPLTQVGCGRAFGQSVSIVGCTLDATLHAYVHQDHPHASYLGTSTVDVHLQQMPGTHNGNVTITVFSPKSHTVLQGAGSQVDISTCH
jgi:hypothetical protein